MVKFNLFSTLKLPSDKEKVMHKKTIIISILVTILLFILAPFGYQ